MSAGKKGESSRYKEEEEGESSGDEHDYGDEIRDTVPPVLAKGDEESEYYDEEMDDNEDQDYDHDLEQTM